MSTTYEYRFVRLGENRGSTFFGVEDKARTGYEDTVHQHARDGWRLVQIFAPGIAAFGAAKYYELIFERQILVGERPLRRSILRQIGPLYQHVRGDQAIAQACRTSLADSLFVGVHASDRGGGAGGRAVWLAQCTTMVRAHLSPNR